MDDKIILAVLAVIMGLVSIQTFACLRALTKISEIALEIHAQTKTTLEQVAKIAAKLNT